MRKVTRVLLAALLILAMLTGCGAPQEQENDRDSGKETITSGEITKPVEESTQPTTEKNEPTTEATEPSTEPTEPEGTVVIHARIPDSWGTMPCFWAWKIVDNTNAFVQWPGEPMTRKGEWYEIEIPDWCNGVIVNDGGLIQTVDLEIEAGKEVWLDVYDTDDVDISYSQPGARREPSTSDVDYAGSVINGVYQNPGFDISFVLPDSWEFFTNEKLASKNELTGTVTNEQLNAYLNERMEKGNVTTIMGAKNTLGENINLAVEAANPMLAGMSEYAYYLLMQTAMEQELQNMDMDVEIALETTTFRGESACVLSYDMGLCFKQVFIRDEKYTCVVTVTAYSFDNADAVLGAFGRYNLGDVFGDSGDFAVATTAEEFETLCGNYIDMSNYTGKESDGSKKYYLLGSIKQNIQYPMDYSIRLGDATVTIPAKVEDFAVLGWKTVDDLDAQVKPYNGLNVGIFTRCKDVQGRWFYATIMNYSDKYQALRDCDVLSIQIDNMEYSYSQQQLLAVEKAAPFVLNGKITNDSGLQDIFDTMGLPTTMEFMEADWDGNYDKEACVDLSYVMQTDNEYGLLRIGVSTVKNKIISLHYDHQIAL